MPEFLRITPRHIVISAALLLPPGLARGETLDCPQTVAADACAMDAAAAGTGAKFIRPTESTSPRFAVGDAFPIYDYNMLIDPPRYGLPPVDGRWRYYEVAGTIYRVDPREERVIGIVGGGEVALLN